MSLKRPLDLYDSPESSSPPRGPTTKRRHITYLFPSPSSSPTIHTPRTPPRPRAHPIPFDSPTNPFGRKSSLNLTLPRTTSFGKHLPLRFQLVRDGIRGNSRDGVYRIVQVPLNYTFRHLHKLLLFLFGGHPVSVSPSKTIAPHRGRTRPSVAPSKGKATERDDQGHLFEVQKFITLYNAMYKPGQIKSARTLVKLSSVRDPYRYRGEDDFAGYGDGSEEGIAADVAGADGEDDVWWEAEEDFLLSNAWPNGGELSRGIIYHHDPHTQVHITVNTTPVPPRKGVGNKPYVFYASGLVRLRSQPDDGAQGEEDRPEVDLIVDNWNTHDAFDQFLKLSSTRERAKREEEHVARDLVDTSTYPSITDMSNLSGITNLTTPSFSATDSAASDSTLLSSSSPPFLLTPITPFPRHPMHALRVEHAHRRMVKLTRKGMEGLVSESDEDEEQDELGEEVDGGKLEARRRGLEWDPFGDEEEL